MVAEQAMVTSPTLKAIEPPWGGQAAFIRSGAAYKLYQGGQGAGKTVAGVFEVRRYVKRHPGSIVICTEPTFPMVRDILKMEFERQFAAAGELGLIKFRTAEYKYVLGNGSEIWLRQCDKFDALRGPSVAAAWMDEAAQSPYEAFRILVGRLRQRPYPHVFMFTGTPRGRNWLYYIFHDGDRPEGAPPYLGRDGNMRVEAFYGVSLQNPYLDEFTKAGLRAAYPPGTKMYDQEVLGQTVVWQGLVFESFDPAIHVRALPEKTVFDRVVIGGDFGWTHPGSLIVLGKVRDEHTIYAIHEVYQARRTAEWWTDAAVDLARQYRPDSIRVDPSAAHWIGLMANRGLPVTAANNDVIASITLIQAGLAGNRLYITPECPNLSREMQAWEWKMSRAGDIRQDTPSDVGDDAIDGLRYGYMALEGRVDRRYRIRFMQRVVI